MSKSNVFEAHMLNLVFNAVAIPELAEDDSTSPAANIVVALHTGDPGEAGDQTTTECTYTGYTRVNVVRTSGGWTVSGTTPTVVSPNANIDFPQATGGSETASYFSVGTGTGDYMMYSGAISPTIVISNGVTPRLTTASTISED